MLGESEQFTINFPAGRYLLSIAGILLGCTPTAILVEDFAFIVSPDVFRVKQSGSTW